MIVGVNLLVVSPNPSCPFYFKLIKLTLFIPKEKTVPVDVIWIQEVFCTMIDTKKQDFANELDSLGEELTKWKYDRVSQVCDRLCLDPMRSGTEDAFLVELYHNSLTVFPQLSVRLVELLQSSKYVRPTWNGEEFVWEWSGDHTQQS